MKVFTVPTGRIFVMDGAKGQLEFLSLADYGKDKNIKANFLGIDRELNGVPSGEPMSLEEKWVITISSQYGCSMNCRFCDVPKVGAGRNASIEDLNRQVMAAIAMAPSCYHTKRLNIHYARMREPTFNPAVLAHAMGLKKLVSPILHADVIHPVVSTMLPRRNEYLPAFISTWGIIKNDTYKGEAGLQFSINSTSDEKRDWMFSGNSLTLEEISGLAKRFLSRPKGRKYTLNFALSDDSEIDAGKLRRLFDPDWFMVKITPIHKTDSCVENEIRTSGGYTRYAPYKKAEQDLLNEGFDVLVFVPSMDEDESLITCGNAVLPGTSPRTEFCMFEF